MNGLKERLERLRRTASSADAGIRQEEYGADAGQRSRESSGREREQGIGPGGEQGDRAVPGAVFAHPRANALPAAFQRLGIEEAENENGVFLLRRIVYPFPHRHGRHDLQLLHAAAPLLHPVACRQNGRLKGTRRIPAAPEETPVPQAGGLLFLDTETTGLGVGAGNVPFMVGVGRCTEHAFIVEQGLIRHPGEERAMLTWLLARFQGVTHLVTYNGRSFDWPVLANRYILNGWRRSGAEPGHLDFLHPARALWRHTLPTCRLGTVEEERLGIVRGDDVPGALAPELYMRYLQDGSPEHLTGIYVHNEKDILTLAALAVHFGRLLGGGLGSDVPEPADAEETFRTAVWLEQHGRDDEARQLYERLAAEPDGADGEVGRRLALAGRYKRIGRLELALPLWERAASLAESARFPRADAHLELAMYYEHKAKDYGKALHYAETALSLAVRRSASYRLPQAAREEQIRIEKRIDRLRRKLLRRSETGQGGWPS
jgi:uncharacterized protein YprB with RNaseH-like and TPR domain